MSPPDSLVAHSTTVATAGSAVVAFDLGIDGHWWMAAVGITVGTLAKALIRLSQNSHYNWLRFVTDATVAIIMFFLAGFIIENWSLVISVPLSTFGLILLSCALALAGDKILPMLEWMGMSTASKALGKPGATSRVVLPPVGTPEELLEVLRKLKVTEPGA